MATAQKKSINLLPQDPFERSFAGKFLKWALSIGRYIVIGTELVVIGSFLARFSLDRQVTDLNEAIAQEQSIVASYGDLEQEARAIQERLALVASLVDRQPNVENLLREVSVLTPVDVVYSFVGLSAEKAVLRGIAFSEGGFRTLLAVMQESRRFDQVRLNRVSSDGDRGAGIEFEVEMLVLGDTGGI